jgi:hypothetical protein
MILGATCSHKVSPVAEQACTFAAAASRIRASGSGSVGVNWAAAGMHAEMRMVRRAASSLLNRMVVLLSLHIANRENLAGIISQRAKYRIASIGFHAA